MSDYAGAQILAMTNHRLQLYNLVRCDAFKMIITKLFYFDLSRKNFCPKIFRSKDFYGMSSSSEAVGAEALRVETEAI